MTAPDARQYLDVLFAVGPDERLKMAARALDDNLTATACWQCGHTDRLDEYADQRRAFVEACDDLIGALPDLSDAARPGIAAAIRRLATTLKHYPEF